MPSQFSEIPVGVQLLLMTVDAVGGGVHRDVDDEAAAGQRVVAMGFEPAVDAVGDAGGADSRQHAFTQVRERIGDRRDEHVAGDTADGIEVDPHVTRDLRPVT